MSLTALADPCDDLICGGSGSDDLTGGPGEDRINGAGPWLVDGGETGKRPRATCSSVVPGTTGWAARMATTSSAGGRVTTASSMAPVATDFAAVPGRAECGATVLPGEEQLFSDGLGRDLLELVFSPGGQRASGGSSAAPKDLTPSGPSASRSWWTGWGQ